MTEKTKVICPNCGGEADREGNKIVCISCDAIFEFRKTGAATAVKIGWKEELEGRVGALEALLGSEQQQPEPEPKKEEDDIL